MSEVPHEPEQESQEPQTYELAEVDDEPTPAQKPGLDPRLASHDLEEEADDVPPPSEDTGGNTSRPKLLEGIPEPKYVDPEVQSIRREDARKRAAKEAAVAAAQSRRVKLWTLVGLVIVAAVIAFWLLAISN